MYIVWDASELPVILAVPQDLLSNKVSILCLYIQQPSDFVFSAVINTMCQQVRTINERTGQSLGVSVENCGKNCAIGCVFCVRPPWQVKLDRNCVVLCTANMVLVVGSTCPYAESDVISLNTDSTRTYLLMVLRPASTTCAATGSTGMYLIRFWRILKGGWQNCSRVPGSSSKSDIKGKSVEAER